jgi:hypothetical protein
VEVEAVTEVPKGSTNTYLGARLSVYAAGKK